MKQHQPKWFNNGFAIFLILLGSYCLIFPKGSESVICYRNYHPILNAFFYYVTKLGEYYLLVPIALYVILNKRDFLGYAVAAFVAQFLLVHILKRWIDAPRPLLFFQDTIQFKLIEGVPALFNHSMPSGHTALGVCTFYTIAYLWSNRSIQSLALFFAIAVGLSRIFLLCHFAADVWVGALIGWACAFAAVYRYENRKANIN